MSDPIECYDANEPSKRLLLVPTPPNTSLVTAAVNPVTGGRKISGVNTTTPVSACRFFYPARQPIGSGNVKDYGPAGNDLILKAGFTDDGTGPWANDGFFTTKSGTTGMASLATIAAGGFDLATQSLILAFSYQKASPSGGESICGNADTATSLGVYLSARAGGKMRPIINTSTGAVTGLADSALTFSDNTRHEVLLAIDAVSKAVYLYRDGWLSNAYLSAYTGNTAAQNSAFTFGSQNSGASVTYDAKFANMQLYVMTGALPANLNLIAQQLATRPGRYLTDLDFA